MSSTFYSDLSNNFGLLLNNEIEYNVVIQVGEDTDYKEFRAHSIILRSRSPYFQKSFSSNEIKDENNISTFKFPNINQTVFQTILTYIYTGSVDLTYKQGDEIFHILYASYEFSLDTLTKFIENYFIENHSKYLRKYPVEILQSILNTNYTFDELQELYHFKKIGPYEEILPKELKQDILQFHMVPEYTSMLKSSPRVPKNMNFDSIILNRKQFINLANLMDDKDNESAYINNIPYNFKLDHRLIKCYRETGISFLNNKVRFNKNSSFVIVYSFLKNRYYNDMNCAGGYLYSSKYCRGGYFYCDYCNEDEMIFTITDWRNIVTEYVYLDFNFLRSYGHGKGSFEIFRVEKVVITNTLKTKDNKIDKDEIDEDVDYKIDKNVDCKNEVSLIRRVTTKIFGGNKSRNAKETPETTYDY
ncbi:POZ domain-containing protein [Rhizophagus irregularis]|uniref:POZ domain-containing protein n=1 Tax=Rhizophagus irregularis TaxID=588596 RepID=A0A2N1NCA6_9GLOM|nr:POZ domain-containing protein [Rhizophagus irregularis]